MRPPVAWPSGGGGGERWPCKVLIVKGLARESCKGFPLVLK